MKTLLKNGLVWTRGAGIALFLVAGTTADSLSQEADEETPKLGWVVTVQTGSTLGIAVNSLNQEIVHTFCDVAGMLVNALRLGDSMVCGEGPLGHDYLENIIEPQTSSSNYTIYIKGHRLRMETGGSAMLAALAADSSTAEWAVLDPATGRVVDTDMFTVGMSQNQWSSMGLGEVTVVNIEIGPEEEGEARQIARHTAWPYRYSYQLLQFPMGYDEDVPRVVTTVTGRAWIAREGQFEEDPLLQVFFRDFADALGDQAPGGMPSRMSELHDYGLLLATSETTEVAIAESHDCAMGGPARRCGVTAPIIEGSSFSEVKDISRQPLDDNLFSGFEREEQACDCSCDAFKELKSLTEEDPNAMGKAMCAMDCTSKWIANSCME